MYICSIYLEHNMWWTLNKLMSLRVERNGRHMSRTQTHTECPCAVHHSWISISDFISTCLVHCWAINWIRVIRRLQFYAMFMIICCHNDRHYGSSEYLFGIITCTERKQNKIEKQMEARRKIDRNWNKTGRKMKTKENQPQWNNTFS